MSPSAKKKRDYGSGSVYQRASDGRWLGSIVVGFTPSGGLRRKYVSGKTERQAQQRLDALRRKIERGEVAADGVSNRTTVKTWSDSWLETTQKKLRPKTWTNNRTAVTKWIVPTIGHKRLDALAPGDVRAVTSAITDAGRTLSTATRTFGVLHKMLVDATLEGHAVPQRVLMVAGPGMGENDRDALSIEDALKMLEAAAAQPDGSRWVAALLQGVRQGECLGLTWDCVDLDAGELDISWQLQALPYKVKGDRSSGFRVPTGYKARQLNGALHLVRPKTAAGTRVIPLVPWMAAALEQWRQVAPPSPHGLVWPRPDGQPRSDKADLAAWKALQVTAGVQHSDGRPYVGHEARHTTATLLMEADVQESVIIAILGQSELVRAYVHTRRSETRRALEKVAERLGLTA